MAKSITEQSFMRVRADGCSVNAYVAQHAAYIGICEGLRGTRYAVMVYTDGSFHRAQQVYCAPDAAIVGQWLTQHGFKRV